MNSFWPTFPRYLCPYPQLALRKSHVVENLVRTLSHNHIRSYSHGTIPYRYSNNIYHLSRVNPLFNVNYLISTKKATRNYSTKKEPILRHFNDLPEDYDDSKGLAYREKPISSAETKEIFGDVIDIGTADRVLRGLHGRRVAGTLEDPMYNNVFEKKIVDKALIWLRENVPVNEDLNAGLRAEKELAEMESDLVADAERIGLYNPNSGIEKDIYGQSAFDKIRESNIKKRELDEAIQKEKIDQADEILMNSGSLEIPTAKVELERSEEHPWLKYYRERANVLPDTPPVMTAWQRLWPSGLMMLGVVATSLVFAMVYSPPKKSARIFPDMPISAATVIGIIIANTTIFCMWRVPMFWRFLNKYFITFPGYPRSLSILGCFWSHQTIPHLVLNMSLLYFIGTKLHEDIGRGNFLAFYVSAGTMSSFFSLFCWVLMKNFSSSSIGASGAVIAVMTAYLISNRGEKMKFFGVFPPDNWPSISAIALLGLLLSYDLIALRRFHKTGKGLIVDHYGHLGGYIAGTLWAYPLSLKSGEKKARHKIG
ncbi:putative rhomboid family protein [Golovinomyces cichoracearum]|uniref:Putative rhomboid family protein n=1 Tax=Golovinomyces cichoracearum TaxID=62708 RepID=A0A420IPY7_9PEZI|nr:putative rhomboid family protein [Golovinomyces cichoracearum]